MQIKTSGKLYIAGEYQVLNSGGIAIVYGLNKFIEFEIQESKQYIYQNDNADERIFEYNDKKLDFHNKNNNEIIKKAFEVIFMYLELQNIDITPFKIIIRSELESNSGEKYGFGSSSAIISGVIKAVATYFEVELSNELLFKLSVYAQKLANELTSGGDLAASIYGTTVLYQRYDTKWFNKQDSLEKIISKKWRRLKIVPFETKLNFAAIWTKKSYKTKDIDLDISKKMYRKAKTIVNKMFVNLLDNKYLLIKENIKDYQLWLENILSDNNLITKEISKTLRILNKFNLSGKVSGAGGGDSVIFLYPEGYNFTNLKEELEIYNLELIMLKE